jgi:hypothetical protein
MDSNHDKVIQSHLYFWRFFRQNTSLVPLLQRHIEPN